MVFHADLSLTKVRPVPIHTSDVILYKRCRRKWSYQSHIRGNLGQTDMPAIAPLWFGSGFHFAMEDFHGYNKFGDPYQAFLAYARCFDSKDLPEQLEELFPLARGMLGYYTDHWLPKHRDFKTHWIGGVPQVEVSFRVPIDGIAPDDAMYCGTFDRVVEDGYGSLFIVDYKTAAKIDTLKLETDPQVSAYTWAGRQVYGPRLEGVVYMQHLKAIPGQPTRLQNGEFSQNKSSVNYTRAVYRKALVDTFGSVPQRYIEFLNYLSAQEGRNGDSLVRISSVKRNDAQVWNEGQKIAAVAKEMINPDLYLYPNPTVACSSDCPFKNACVSFDEDGHWESFLEGSFAKKDSHTKWRSKLLDLNGDPYDD